MIKPLRSLSTSVLVAASSVMTATAPAPAQVASDSNRKPNVVLILADDMGWNGVSFHENGFVKTPNIDRIARQGVELDRYYVSPMCSPTRAGLMTGRYPMRYGMARSVVRPWAKFGLPPAERTLPEALGEAGYKNRGMFGKWHLGHLDPKWHPLSQGFTYYKGCYNGAANYFDRDRDGQTDWHVNWDDVQEEGYTTDLISDGAAQFVRQHAKDGPFFLYVAHTAPHDPLQAPQKYIDQYAHLDDTPNDGKPSEKQLTAAMIACMDDGVGRLLKALEETGVARDTIVYFSSDNGGPAGIPSNNAPLRGGKMGVHEGGVRVPAAVWWPGVIEGGRKIDTPLVNVDIMPTLLRACGVSAKENPGHPLDGRDAFDVLRGKPASGELASRDVYMFVGQSGLEDEQIAVSTADGWKLVVIGPDVSRPEGYSTPKHRVELFRLSEDPYEKTDLAAREPQRVKELGQKVVAFRKSEGQPSLPPMNRKPPKFEPPKNWHNAPANAGDKKEVRSS